MSDEPKDKLVRDVSSAETQETQPADTGSVVVGAFAPHPGYGTDIAKSHTTPLDVTQKSREAVFPKRAGKPERKVIKDEQSQKETGKGPTTMKDYLKSLPPAQVEQQEESDVESQPESHVSADRESVSEAEAPMAHFAAQHLLDPEEYGVNLTAECLEGEVSMTDPAVMDPQLVPELNRAWSALFGANNKHSMSRVISAICLYFAVNSTSSRIPPKESITLMVAGRKVSVSLERIMQTAYEVTGTREARAIMRRYAGLTRSVLKANKHVRTKMFTRFRFPHNLRHIAFDYADYCDDPPLTSLEEEFLAMARAQLIKGTNESDDYQREHQGLG